MNQRVLRCNLIAGGVLTLASTLVVGWLLPAIAAVYVVIASGFLAVVYARPRLSRAQEISAWVAPWLLAVALWTGVFAAPELGDPGGSLLFALWPGSVVATLCYLVWQALALVVRVTVYRDLRPGEAAPR